MNPENQNKPPPSNKGMWKFLLWSGLVIAGLMVMGVVAESVLTNPEPEPARVSVGSTAKDNQEARADAAKLAAKNREKVEHDAAVYGLTECQMAVENRLVSPGTADFPWTDRQIVVNHETGEAMIRSYVDAENRMGGTIRAEWVCIVKGSGERWSVVELAMDER